MGDKAEVIATYDAPAGSGKISITKGEKVTVVKRTETGWWYGVNVGGDKGYFPSTYVKELPKMPPPPADGTTAASVSSRGGSARGASVRTAGGAGGPPAVAPPPKPKTNLGDSMSDLMAMVSSAGSPGKGSSSPTGASAAAASAGAAAAAAAPSSSSSPTGGDSGGGTGGTGGTGDGDGGGGGGGGGEGDGKAPKQLKSVTAGEGWIAASQLKDAKPRVVLAELREPANDNFRQVWLDDLAREAFREFAYCDEAVEGIVFCEHVERWKRGMVPGATRKLAPPQKLLEEARRIYVRYLDPDPEARKTGPAQDLEVNVAGDVKTDISSKLGFDGVAWGPVAELFENTFDTAVEDVLNYLKQGLFTRFLKSPQYDKYEKSKLLDADSW